MSPFPIFSPSALAIAAVAAVASPAHSEESYVVKPATQTVNTDAGGTEQAKKDAERLQALGVKMVTFRNLLGPAVPVKETETEATTYEVSREFRAGQTSTSFPLHKCRAWGPRPYPQPYRSS